MGKKGGTRHRSRKWSTKQSLVEEYVEKWGFESTLSEIFQKILSEKPENPSEVMLRMLHDKMGREDQRSLSACWAHLERTRSRSTLIPKDVESWAGRQPVEYAVAAQPGALLLGEEDGGSLYGLGGGSSNLESASSAGGGPAEEAEVDAGALTVDEAKAGGAAAETEG
mmetsp:Transcript_11142/g.27262  ORF Transcript_11142/g.27262 Transcript_11142/m.27262 type:complete len:168 (+) Transcript_11142:85-588(+)|eukprot:CAMPEP_0178992430 /NCGR_PEP_ID=MMETSP0795-20121207/6109_1 /TAXON_ID=88552 /ORGANISM="Amoebophrya sp., Strain Ameob2" /LENGTH=167 /DNA_ID=CAMNT_0020684309 /DNA_START=47 /DNA_END=550 /DNA_ORIENTATION=-